MTSKKIAVVYFSKYGHTQKQAEFIAKGAESAENVSVELINIENLTDLSILNQTDAIVFGSPTYNGSIAARFKEFMENSTQIWFTGKWKNKIAGGFTNSGSLSGDKLFVLQQLNIFAMQHGMIWVGVDTYDQSAETFLGDPQSMNRVGTFLGATATSENKSPEETPPKGDLDTAFYYGKRIAEITVKFNL